MPILDGFLNALTLYNLLFCFIGCVLGTLVGILPGLGPSASIAIILPFSVYLDPTGSIIMMAGVCYGAMYGGSTTSILVNIPGESASVVSTFDGFQMTRQGRGGEALWIAAVGSFIAGTIGVIGTCILGPELAKFAIKFGPPEYTGLLFFSLTMLVSLSGASLIKGIVAGILGIFLSSVGIDPLTGAPRLNYGLVGLTRGFEIVPVVVGLFGIGEILSSAEAGVQQIFQGKLGRMMPRGSELRRGLFAALRGTILGFPLGLIPGMVTALSTFMSYDVEKKISKHPERFGKGAIEGLAGPEAANNATAQAGFIPLLSLGIPTAPSMAIMLAAFMLYGLQPGPQLFLQHGSMVWTVIASMYIGNVMLLVLNLPLVGLWARISLIPYRFLAPFILAVCLIGAYSPRCTMFDVWVALAFGILGYYMNKNKWPVAPMILGLILGPIFEISLRQSISMGTLSGGIIALFLSRPVSVVFIALAVIALVISFVFLKRLPKDALEDDSKK
ncbi:MAG: tripartite tricarboxylate transporter permease [Deltaproteobacteria bacterium]|nr:tripartite tricarboxylate transporter permease [Deltaproteobacteria bacterium]